MNILAGLTAMRDALVPIADAFDQPNNRTLILVNRKAGTYTQIVPNPYVSTIGPQQISHFANTQGIQVEQDSIQVSGISFNYTREQLTGAGIHYVVDGELVNGQVVGGQEFDRIPGIDFDRKPSGWNVVLKARRA